MQLVIDIPEDVKNTIDLLDDSFDAIKEAYYGSLAIMAIQNGTPLPKGHGRLIDADEIQFENTEFETYGDYCIAFDAIDEAPTVIEADKGEIEMR